VAKVAVVGLAALIPLTACLPQAQRREDAAAHWREVRARVKRQLATQQFERGQIDAAIATINEAIGVDNTHAEAHVLLAHCYLEQGHLAAARQAAERAHELAPESAEVAYTRGLIAERSDQLADALQHYWQAWTYDDSVVDYLVAAVECLAALGHPDDALGVVNEHLGAADSDGTLEMLAAQLVMLTDDRERAVRHLRLAFERSGCGGVTGDAPECALVTQEYGRLLSETGRHGEAVAVLRPYTEVHRDAPPSTVAALATGYLATDRAREAKQLLREEVRNRPEHAQAWLLLARAAVATDDWMCARRCAEELVAAAPDGGAGTGAFVLHAFVCWKQNDLHAAEQSLAHALRLDPDEALIHCLAGQVSDAAGRHDAGRKHYRRALQLDPECDWALQALEPPVDASPPRSRETLATRTPLVSSQGGVRTSPR
jgi:Tfp pilus assembly protein PilF